jgi:rubrerythrin
MDMLQIKDEGKKTQFLVISVGDYDFEQEDTAKLERVLIPTEDNIIKIKRLIEDERESVKEYAGMYDALGIVLFNELAKEAAEHLMRLVELLNQILKETAGSSSKAEKVTL